MANTDPLTGLANRRYLDEVLSHLVERARNERFRVTLVLFDFDNFKHYNDAFGHGAGDEILREAGMLIKRCIRRQDFAARYGGDEIAVVLWDWQRRRIPNSEHPRSAMAIMERFRKLLKQHHFTRLGPQVQGSLTISGGLASFPWDAASGEELIERADQALLEAKRSGKDRIYLVGQGAEKLEDLENQHQ
jgi:diguanylate cyclase (GGDEF)-like protein